MRDELKDDIRAALAHRQAFEQHTSVRALEMNSKQLIAANTALLGQPVEAEGQDNQQDNRGALAQGAMAKR